MPARPARADDLRPPETRGRRPGDVTGKLEEELPDGTKYLLFEYNVVRVWELPVAQILAGDLATLPLAPITQVTAEDLPAVVRRMDERIEREASRARPKSCGPPH